MGSFLFYVTYSFFVVYLKKVLLLRGDIMNLNNEPSPKLTKKEKVQAFLIALIMLVIMIGLIMMIQWCLPVME